MAYGKQRVSCVNFKVGFRTDSALKSLFMCHGTNEEISSRFVEKRSIVFFWKLKDVEQQLIIRRLLLGSVGVWYSAQNDRKRLKN